MAFSSDDKYRAAKWLNLHLLSSADYRQNYAGYDGYQLYNTKLSSTDYQGSQPLFQAADIETRMVKVTAESAYLVDEVIQVLDDLDSNDALIKNAAISQKGALKKADALEWDTSISKTEGVATRQTELIVRLRYYLKLPPIAPSSSVAYLERS